MNDIEKIQADFFDENAIQPATENIYRIDIKGNRFYLKIDDNFIPWLAPSWTTLSKTMPTDPYLIKWMREIGDKEYKYQMKNSADYGTLLHVVFGNILKGKEFYISEKYLFEFMETFYKIENIRNDNERYNFNETRTWYREHRKKGDGNFKKDVLGFVQWIKDFEVNPIAIEYPLISTTKESEIEYGDNKIIICTMGTAIDLVARIKISGVESVALIDFKTGYNGFYETNIYQLHGNSTIWRENNKVGKTVIDKVFNYGCNEFRMETFFKYIFGGKTGVFKPYKFKEQEITDLIKLKWDLYVDIFHADKSNFEIKSRYEVDELQKINININLSELITEFNIIENIITQEKEMRKANL